MSDLYRMATAEEYEFWRTEGSESLVRSPDGVKARWNIWGKLIGFWVPVTESVYRIDPECGCGPNDGHIEGCFVRIGAET